MHCHVPPPMQRVGPAVQHVVVRGVPKHVASQLPDVNVHTYGERGNGMEGKPTRVVMGRKQQTAEEVEGATWNRGCVSELSLLGLLETKDEKKRLIFCR